MSTNNPNDDLPSGEEPERIPESKSAARRAAEIDEETRIKTSVGNGKSKKILVKESEETYDGATVKVFKG